MPDKNFNPKSIAIAATTFYPNWYRGKLRSIKHTDKIRGDLALELVNKTCMLGYQIVISDWQSPKSFRKELQNIPGIVLIKRRSKKRSPSKRQVLRKASKLPGVEVIVLTEPEKVSIISDCLLQIVEPVFKGEADIVIPKRNDELFRQTYPSYQYESEVEGNKTYNEELISHRLLEGKDNDLDMFFGPRVLANKKSVVSFFMRRYHFSIAHATFPQWCFDVEESSNASYFPIIVALKKGLKIKSIEVPFRYPKLQKQNEDIGSREEFLEKRKVQRISLIIELLHFVAYLEKNI